MLYKSPGIANPWLENLGDRVNCIRQQFLRNKNNAC